MEQQDLGELKTVSNTLRDHRFEADDLIVGWVLVDGAIQPVAFTERELRRPQERAADNREDMPTLGAKPPTREQFEDLHKEHEKLLERYEAMRNRNLLDRILNTGVDDAD